VKALCARRPDHGLNPSKRERITFAPRDSFAEIAGNIGARQVGKRRNDGRRARYARYSSGFPRYSRYPELRFHSEPKLSFLF
jgi:hypothetical protein